MDGHELINARFSDSNHLNVITLWKDKDNNVVEQLISADPTQPQWNQLMKHTTEKEVWDNTTQWKFDEKKKFDAYIEPLVNAEVEKRVSIEVEKRLKQKHSDIVNELEVKREEVKKNVQSIQTLSTDNKILTNDNRNLASDLKRLDEELIDALEIGHEKTENIQTLQERVSELNNRVRAFPPDIIFNNIINNNKEEDFIFKVKLAVFEIPEVKKSKSKTLKTKIRKAKTVLELCEIVNKLLK